MGQVAKILQQNKLEQQALKIATDAVSKFPDEYALWVILASMSNATAEQKTEALTQMKRLDPLNPNLK
jgi:predicted Zn-dependent protease